MITGAREVTGEEGGASDRVRRPGGGRPKATDKNPNLLLELDHLVHPETRGDPMSPLKWTLKSTAQLARALSDKGFEASPTLVRGLLPTMGYSLQGVAQQNEGAQHPDRDGQFRYIAERCGEFLAAGQPVISVDCARRLAAFLGAGLAPSPSLPPVNRPTSAPS